VLNIKDIRNELAAKYPEDADEIMNSKRPALKKWCKNVKKEEKIVDDVLGPIPRHNRPGKGYTEREKKFCRCVSHVSAKQENVNPYAVCKSSTGQRANVKCMDYYVEEYDMPEDEIKAMAKMKKKHVDQFRREVKGEAPVVIPPKKYPEIKRRRIVRSVPRESAPTHVNSVRTPTRRGE